MTSPSSGRERRGGGRRGRDWQGWNGPGWHAGPTDDWPGRGRRGWGGEWQRGDWRAAGWVGDSRETGRDEPQDAVGSTRGGVPGKRVRIGDADRDQAVSLLSEHFVAGRLTQAEFEERSEVATRARYSDEFAPLFDDLPSSTDLQVAPRGPANLRRRTGPPPPFMMLAPVLMIGLVISSIALAAPWLLWGMFWVVMISGVSRRRWHHNHH